MQAIKTEFSDLLRRNDLMRSALFAGKVQDINFDADNYVEQIMELAARVWHRSTRSKHDVIFKLQNINEVLFKDFELEGKTDKYKQVIDDPQRFYLHRVLDRKMGSPLSITILYAIFCEQMGIPYECIALPSYYLLKITDLDTEFYVDAFDRGRLLSCDEFQKKFRAAMQRNRVMSSNSTLQTNLFEKVTVQQLVARLVQQLKHIYILKGSALEALRAVEFLTLFYPSSPELTRDRGILYCEMEYFSKAMEDLRFYLKQRPNADDVSEIKKLTAMLKGYREIMN